MTGGFERSGPTEADVERLAAQIRLPIAPESRAAVARHLAALLSAAQIVDEFALPDAAEPASHAES
jgi:hypothetical protein